jgi:hypothetical protein
MVEFIKAKFGQKENINRGHQMQPWTEKIDFGNGIKCYRNIIKKEFDVINRIESNLKPVGDRTGYS